VGRFVHFAACTALSCLRLPPALKRGRMRSKSCVDRNVRSARGTRGDGQDWLGAWAGEQAGQRLARSRAVLLLNGALLATAAPYVFCCFVAQRRKRIHCYKWNHADLRRRFLFTPLCRFISWLLLGGRSPGAWTQLADLHRHHATTPAHLQALLSSPATPASIGDCSQSSSGQYRLVPMTFAATARGCTRGKRGRSATRYRQPTMYARCRWATTGR